MSSFLAGWWHTLPLRRHFLVRPYAQALGLFVAGYGGLTWLLRPWPLGAWWSFGVPLVAGLGAVWGLRRSWVPLAPNARHLSLLLTGLLYLALGYSLRQLLFARLGAVRDLRSVAELAQPGEAVYFRLHGPYYVAKAATGRYTTTDSIQSKGTNTYYATCAYACPLLAAPAAHRASAWLGYRYHQELGYALSADELRRYYARFVARCDAHFDSFAVVRFTYLEREESPAANLYYAVRRSPLAGSSATRPLLLKPVAEPFSQRGWGYLGIVLLILVALNPIICLLLLVLPLRPPGEWPAWRG